MRSAARQVKLFRNGRNQALRIPREFELEGNRALVHREGERLIVQPLRKGRLLAVLASLEPLDERLADVDEEMLPLDDPALA
jgi:antitoxin VapB